MSHTAASFNTDRYVTRMRDLHQKLLETEKALERMRRHVALAWVIASVSNAITLAVLIIEAFK